MSINHTAEQTNKVLTQLIVENTDQDIITWGNLQEDGCSYETCSCDDILTVYCCKNAEKKRQLWKNDKLTSLTSSEVNEICQAIERQKIRLSGAQKVSEEAILSLTYHKNNIMHAS